MRRKTESVAPAAQYTRASGVERSGPHFFRAIANYGLYAFLQLAGSLVGECYGQYLPRFGKAGLDDISYPVHQHGRLSRACAGKYQQGPFGVEHSLPLHGIH